MSQQRGLGEGEGSWAARVIVYGVFVLFWGFGALRSFFLLFWEKFVTLIFFLVFLEVLHNLE